MVNYTVKGIPPEDYTELRVLAAREGISVNKMILRIIAKFIIRATKQGGERRDS